MDLTKIVLINIIYVYKYRKLQAIQMGEDMPKKCLLQFQEQKIIIKSDGMVRYGMGLIDMTSYRPALDPFLPIDLPFYHVV